MRFTDLTITADNARHLARGGRSRWKIENETFNTLKNQGYHFEHNYGHGNIHLSVVFAMLMMLTFLVDQTQELCCPLFQAVQKKLGSRRAVWDHIWRLQAEFERSWLKRLQDSFRDKLVKFLSGEAVACLLRTFLQVAIADVVATIPLPVSGTHSMAAAATTHQTSEDSGTTSRCSGSHFRRAILLKTILIL